MKNIITILTIATILLLLAKNSEGQTVISAGDVNGVWTAAGSPYQIEGDIIVQAGETLEIEAGVKVEFQGYYKLLVHGKLQASGAKDNMIHFTINDTTGFWNIANTQGGWNGIRLQENNDALSIVDYCKFEFVKRNEAIRSDSINILISNSVFTRNKRLVIDVLSPRSMIRLRLYNNDVFVFNNKICNNDGAGITVIGIGSDNSFITNNLISNNITGIFTSSLSNIHISNNTICNNENFGLHLIRSEIDIYNCIIYGNYGYNSSMGSIGLQCWFDYDYDPGVYNFYNCNVQGVENSVLPMQGASIVTGTDIINSDPQFINPTITYGIEHNALDADWRLALGSPSINAGYPDTTGLGIPATDLAGKTRVYDNIIDIGAYEYTGYNSVEEQEGDGQITVFPIPANNKINIILKDVISKEININIYNISGKAVYSKTVTNNNKYSIETIDLANQSTGTYILKIDYNSRKFSQKFLINRP